jgi:hypothetical protein
MKKTFKNGKNANVDKNHAGRQCYIYVEVKEPQQNTSGPRRRPAFA